MMATGLSFDIFDTAKANVNQICLINTLNAIFFEQFQQVRRLYANVVHHQIHHHLGNTISIARFQYIVDTVYNTVSKSLSMMLSWC